MADLPDGMSQEAFDYLLAFTREHEGDTPFMYNNFPLKSPTLDVTAGIGISVPTEDAAARPDVIGMFTFKESQEPVDEVSIRAEWQRVASIERTTDNLFTAYRDASPMEILPEALLDALTTKMLQFWSARGRNVANFDEIPWQAQVALVSINYGLRLTKFPKMCTAVEGNDFATAASESHVNGWDERKNKGHNILLMNAAIIVRDGRSFDLLPDQPHPEPLEDASP